VTSLRELDERALRDAVARAREGDRTALEEVVSTLQHDVFHLALRMTAHIEDAEDASQEVLVKVVTRLESFRGDSSVRTWAYRIAVRHLLDRKKSRVEALTRDFESFGSDLLDGLAVEPDSDPIAASDVKIGCTLAMLTCLQREQRIAYILCDVFDLSTADAAAVCEASEETLRQRLSRARRTLEAFTTSFCGLVAPDAPCSCSKRVGRAVEIGRVRRRQVPEQDVVRARHEMESLHTTASLMRSHPEYRAPERLRAAVGMILEQPLRVLESSRGPRGDTG
jgi:RNA polymerase sigma factor (sigma-70 family)